MVDAVSGVNPYIHNTGGVGRAWQAVRVHRAAMPGVPVQPVAAVTPVADASAKPEPVGLGLPQGAAADLAEMNVRQNMRPFEGEQILATSVGGAWLGEKAGSTQIPGQLLRLANEDAETALGLPNGEAEAARMKILGSGEEEEAWQMRLPGAPKEEEPFSLLKTAEDDEQDDEEDEKSALNGAQEAAEEGKCETCERRKYQDGSNDAGVSFKTPTRIDPRQVASAVRGHEMEHVYREQAKAKREGRKVVNQTVTLHNAICPECGRVYISGGTTRTSTMADVAANASNQVLANRQAGSGNEAA